MKIQYMTIHYFATRHLTPLSTYWRCSRKVLMRTLCCCGYLIDLHLSVGPLHPNVYQPEETVYEEDRSGSHWPRTSPHSQTSQDPPQKSKLRQHQTCRKTESVAVPSHAVIKSETKHQLAGRLSVLSPWNHITDLCFVLIDLRFQLCQINSDDMVYRQQEKWLKHKIKTGVRLKCSDNTAIPTARL